MEAFLAGALSGGALVTVGGGAVVWLCRVVVGNYLTARATNLATKQDIAGITQIEQGILTQFEGINEDRRIEGRLRLAVVEQRFKAHQDAYALWVKLIHSVHAEDNMTRVMNCQEWWYENNLYLDKKPREAFIVAVRAASQHQFLLESFRGTDESGHVTENWEKLCRLES